MNDEDFGYLEESRSRVAQRLISATALTLSYTLWNCCPDEADDKERLRVIKMALRVVYAEGRFAGINEESERAELREQERQAVEPNGAKTENHAPASA